LQKKKKYSTLFLGQLELLKLSFFPAIFTAAPVVAEYHSEEAEAFTRKENGKWALEYAGCVRNML
jgi:hypothetical protein